MTFSQKDDNGENKKYPEQTLDFETNSSRQKFCFDAALNLE